MVITGLRAGGSGPINTGGVIQPWRQASNHSASDGNGLRVGRGGPISATTRSRSVTRTVSPPAARRTYSLSLFLSSLRPTERITANVASRGYFVKIHRVGADAVASIGKASH